MDFVFNAVFLYALIFAVDVSVASIIVAILKLIFFYRIRFAYNRMFKLAMAGTGIGIITVATLNLPLVNILSNIWSDKLCIKVPFWSMLTGLFIGTAVTFYYKDKKQNQTAG